MKLTVFQSDKGDCLLLSSADEKTQVLVDGGMAHSYSEHAAATLGQLRARGADLDLVYISHIDQDHISGIVQMLDDEASWRVHDYQRKTGNTEHPEPSAPRPPKVKEIWHNGFREQLQDNAGPVEEMLAASATVLKAGPEAGRHQLAASYENLATGVSDAIQLSHRAAADQLQIPINRGFDGKLAVLGTKPKTIQRGSLRFSLLAPHKPDLEKLREVWNDWLEDNQAELARLRARMQSDIESLGAAEVEILSGSFEAQAVALASTALAVPVLGNRTRVTAPNLASLMFLVTEGEKTLLLTGDGHAREILSGLEIAGKLKPGALLHVDVLKVQHHGSEFNITTEFCRRLSADHYIFCANGEHANPDERVLELILDSRLNADTAEAGAASGGEGDAETRRDGKFHLWFNSSAKAEGADAEHMEKVERLVRARAGRSNSRFSYSFLDGDSFELEI